MYLSLTPEQVALVEQRLAAERIHFSTLHDELLDHLCCKIENQLESGIAFHDACDRAFASFGEEGMKELQSQTIQLVQQKSRLMRHLFLALSAILFPTFLFWSGYLHRAFQPTEVQHVHHHHAGNTPVDDLRKTNTAREVLQPLELSVPSVEFCEGPPSCNPLEGNYEITSGFGQRMHPVYKRKKHHRGVDLKASLGTPVVATSDGVISISRMRKKGSGNFVEITHDDVYKTTYSHLHEILVSNGQQVKKGEVIATVGSSGFSTAPHLHYEVWVNGKAVDPSSFMTQP
ncbi:MAG: M23 family metallopeptidase [Bacteroidota bacterium]